MRSLDPLQQQQQQQAQHQQHMGSPLPPPVAQMGAPYYHSNQSMPHPSQYPNVTSDPLGAQNMRYPIAAPDNRIMSGGRHKKVIGVETPLQRVLQNATGGMIADILLRVGDQT
jgi:hypothetical protein